MPKQRSVPSYLFHRARNCAVVTINGRNHYLGPFNSPASKQKYARLIAELATGIAAPAKAAANAHNVTITELCATYLEWASGYYVKNGRATSQVDVIRMALRKLYGETVASKFGPLAFEALQRSLVDDDRTRSYVNKVSAEVRRLFKWGARKELVPVAVHQALATVPGLARGRTTARETAPVLPVDDATVEATLPYLSPVVAGMVRFQALVGCRPTEVCMIRPADVDTTGEVWTYTPAEHKTEHHGRERRIFIGPKAQDILRPYLLRPADMYCFRSETTRRTARGHFTNDTYNHAITAACKKAGFKPWKPNQLRHAAGTAIRQKFGIEAAQVILGHARADVTQVYAERDWSKAADVMKAIGEWRCDREFALLAESRPVHRR